MDTKTPFVSDEQKPFNGHTKGNATAIPFDERWMVSTPEQIVLITVGGNDEENARFAAHCWNTYYQREAELQALRDRVEPRDRILQELVDGIEEVRKINADLVSRGPMDTAAGHCLRVSKAALAKAKEQFGIEPSNQK